MSLSLYFNKKEAVDAGLVIKQEREEYIDEHELNAVDIYDYVEVPGTDIKRQIGYGWSSVGFNDKEPDTIDMVANKWGSVYKPMTDWLSSNGINWNEF